MAKIDWEKVTLRKFAELISAELNNNNIKAVLVGGACVSIYSRNKYQSQDLDYISPDSTEKISEALKKLGFTKKGNFRHFSNVNCPFYIEFPPGPIALGNEFPKKYNELASITLLTPTDCVKDRLAAFYHWNDEQSLEQALLVARKQKVNLAAIKKWSQDENNKEKYNRFIYLLKKKKQPTVHLRGGK